MDSLSLKDQLDAWFKLSDAIDRFWQMFIYVTAAVLIALASTFVPRIENEVFDVLRLLTIVFYYLFLFMNYKALVNGYQGLHAVTKDIKAEVKVDLRSPNKVQSKSLKTWIFSLDYSDRVKYVRIIYAYSIFIITAIALVHRDRFVLH